MKKIVLSSLVVLGLSTAAFAQAATDFASVDTDMSGGVSHVDSFDYKPRLFADHNQPYQVPKRMLQAFAANNRSEVKYFKRPDWDFKQRGQSGLWISDLFPKIAERADVGAGTVYNYFKSKDDLAIAVLETLMHDLAVRIEQVTNTFADPAQVYAFGIRSVLDTATSDVRWAQMLNRSEVIADAMFRVIGPFAIRDLRLASQAGRFSRRQPLGPAYATKRHSSSRRRISLAPASASSSVAAATK